MNNDKLKELNDMAAIIKRNEENIESLRDSANLISNENPSRSHVSSVRILPMNAGSYVLETIDLPPAAFPHIVRALENYAEILEAEASITRAKFKQA